MLASIIVCTYNRCVSLAETLEALMRQQVRADTPWELIVVDNDSTDGTREWLVLRQGMDSVVWKQRAKEEEA